MRGTPNTLTSFAVAIMIAATSLPAGAQDMRDSLGDRPGRDLPPAQSARTPEPKQSAPKPKRRRRRRKSASRSRAGRTVVEGIRAMDQGNHSKAIVIFERAVKQDSRWSNAYFHLGNAYYHKAFAAGSAERADQDEAANAIDALETALALDPNLRSIRQPHKLYHALGQSYEALGRHKDALNSIKMAARTSPRNPMPFLYGARLRLKMRDFVMSSKNFYSSVMRARRIRSYPQLSKMVRSNGLFVPLLSVPQNRLILDAMDAVSEGTLTLSEAKERIRTGDRSDLRDALTDRPSASAMTPKVVRRAETRQDPDVLKAIELGHLAFNVRRYREAIQHYQAAFDLDDRRGTMDAVQKSLLLERIGASYRSLGLAGESIRVLKKAVETMPENSTAYYQLALAHATVGKLNESMSFLKRALETARSMAEMRKTLLLAKTDSEFESLYDKPRFEEIVKIFEKKTTRR
ncbi:MAG: hypothetical protein COB53_09840 [Elusimicrobia bacterium]|nr:MAG: hypothetical protein COB53_09840 [Elusimicrobiota bacterium]